MSKASGEAPAAKKVARAKKPESRTKTDSEHRRKLFVEAYLSNGGNATQAAVAAGLSEKTATVTGSRMLNRVDVSTMIKQRRKAVVEKFELTTERTLREIARLAYFDPRKFFHEDGRPKQIQELDEDTAAALAGIEVTEEFEGTGQDRVFKGFTKKYKLADKNSALEKAMKHLGEYEADNRQRNPIHEMNDDALQRLIERKAKEAGVSLH